MALPWAAFRRWWFRIGLGLLGMLLAIQLVPYGRDHNNPPVMTPREVFFERVTYGLEAVTDVSFYDL